MTKPTASVVITDLDNTLFDWFRFWHAAFSAMLDEIVRISELSRDVLLPEIQRIHETHGTSEYAFLLEEIPSLRERHPDGDILELYQPAIDAYRKARRENLLFTRECWRRSGP